MAVGSRSSLTPVVPGAVPSSWATGVRDALPLRYASGAARDADLAAIGSSEQGMLAYLLDVDLLTQWSGSVWKPAPWWQRVATMTARTAASSGVTTTETVIDSVTVTALANARHRVTWCGTIESSVGSDTVVCRMRYAAGASVTSAGTQFRALTHACDVANRGGAVTIVGEVTGIAAGQTTIGLSIVRGTGSGTIVSAGSATQEVTMHLDVTAG